MMYMSSPIATSAIKTNRTNVVGVGLKLKSRIRRDILNIDAKAADEWEKHAEAEFELWASKKNACDAAGINDFYDMQQLALISWLLSGDSFTVIKQQTPSLMYPYSLRLHIIEADRVSTPTSKAYSFLTETKLDNGNLVYDGVEVDKSGAIVAYHISNNYPFEYKSGKTEWTRVEAYGKNTGLPNILQIMDSERPEQYRGVSYLVHVIEPLLQLRRYTESELMAAVIESFFTVFVTSESQNLLGPLEETNPQDKVSQGPADYEMGPGSINRLRPGESITSADPKRPTSGFDSFVRAMCEQIGAALEVPADLLLKAFNASYSASRAALLEAWKAFKMRRNWFVGDFCQPVYEIWLSEAVARGRITAPGFFTDPLIRAAWLGADWIGPSQGSIDPVKELNAEIMAIKEGLTTREQATVRLNGGSFDANIEQLLKEDEKMKLLDTSGKGVNGINE